MWWDNDIDDGTRDALRDTVATAASQSSTAKTAILAPQVLDEMCYIVPESFTRRARWKSEPTRLSGASPW